VFGAGNQATNADYKKKFDRFINVDQIYNARQKSASEKEVKKVVNIVKKIISANESDEDGYVLLSTIVNQLYKEMPDFNPKVYGAKTNKTSSFFMKELNEYFLTKMEGTIVSIKSKNK
jgi:ribosome-associated translation inhibitor RaiA